MKKRVIGIFLLVLVCLSNMAVFADFRNPSVVDNAGFLTEEQAVEVSGILDSLREKYNMDVAIYTEENAPSDDGESAADDVFDYSGYGAGEGKDGFLLYVSENPRLYHYTAHGAGETAFGEYAMFYIDDEVLPYLKQNDYYGAFLTYANTAADILANPDDYKDDYTAYNVIVIAIAVVVPLLIALIAMLIRQSRMKTAVKQTDAGGYTTPDGLNLTKSQDIFLYSTVTKTPKPKPQESQSSGGHISSSGEHHTGRGGTY